MSVEIDAILPKEYNAGISVVAPQGSGAGGGVPRDEFNLLEEKVDGEIERAKKAEENLQKQIDELPTTGDVNIDALLAEAEKRALRKLYIAAGALYNDGDSSIERTAFWGEKVQHLPECYYLNGLGDITEEQMAKIYNHKGFIEKVLGGDNVARYYQVIDSNGVSKIPRTFLVAADKRLCENQSIGSTLTYDGGLETITYAQNNSTAYAQYAVKATGECFYRMDKLKAIDNEIIVSSSVTSIFRSAPALEYVRLKLSKSFSLATSPNLAKFSIIYAINNFAEPTSAASSDTVYLITLHPTAFAKCDVGGEWYDAIQEALDKKNAKLSKNKYSLSLGA